MIDYVQVGSYGIIDKHTGTLKIRGNIYSEDFEKHFPPGFELSSHSPEESFHEGKLPVRVANSDNADMLMDFKEPPFEHRYNNGLYNSPNLVESTWRIDKSARGACLIMYKPRHTCIPDSGGVFGKLSQISELKSTYLVISAYSCPAYAFWLSDKVEYSPIRKRGPRSKQDSNEDHGVSIIMTSRKGKPHWWQYPENKGTLQSDIGNEDLNGYAFTPFYCLEQILPEDRPLRRAAPSPERKDRELQAPWITGGVPWAPLDEDGEEIEIHDYESDEAMDEQT
ncbi:hypothetical protein M422DRAFT_263134 [Sphaerobolus stellatus SS14]|uniref:Uncharacterized protein n=1 Tax=Sphaerobolus stellatus (strain SS14) TaxID=990650 RepID=A0A0C9TWJ5_SPHS4|nr:hypothetical protein M422DRAFT_263134 [Sphaerobolus stellatus SS14]